MLRLQLIATLSLVAQWTSNVAVTVAAFRVGGAGAVAIALVVRMVPVAVLSPLLGAFIEKRSPLVMLRWASLLGVVVGGITAIAVESERAVTVAMVGGTALSLCVVAMRVSSFLLVPQLVETSAELAAVTTTTNTILSLGIFIGPGLAGVLIAAGEPFAALAAVAVLMALAAALLANPVGVVDQAPRVVGSRTSAPTTRLRGVAVDLVRPLANVDVRTIFGLTVVQTTIGGAVGVLSAPLAIEELDIGEGGVGLLTAALGVGGVVASLAFFGLAGSSRLGFVNAIGLGLWGIPLIALAGPESPVVAVAVMAMVGVGDGIFSVSTLTLVQRAAEPSMLGRTMASVESVVAFGYALGAGISALVGAYPASEVLALMGVVVGIIAVLSLPLVQPMDKRLAAPSAAVDLLRSVPLFAGLPTLAVERLALRLESTTHQPGDVILRQGDFGTRYHLVESGSVDVLVDGRPVATLSPFDGMGEIALLRGSVRTATCIASTVTVTHSIEGDDFLAVLGANSGTLESVAEARLERARPSGTEGGH